MRKEEEWWLVHLRDVARLIAAELINSLGRDRRKTRPGLAPHEQWQ